MQQIYHLNATTNLHIRQQIAKSFCSGIELSKRFSVSKQTISKWKNRSLLQDASSRPHNIKYALTEFENALAISIRTSTWFALDGVFEMLLEQNKNISRSSVC